MKADSDAASADEPPSPPLSQRLPGVVSTTMSGLRHPPPYMEEARDAQSIRLKDGGTARLSWWWAPGYSSSPPATVLFLPGLNNTSYFPFVQHAVSLLRARNFTVVVLDYRATAGQSLTSQRLFGADSWRDLPEIIKVVVARSAKGSAFFGFGHSMGGSCLAKYISAEGPSCIFTAAATISSPYALSAHQARLESSPSWRLLNLITASAARLSLYKMWLTDRQSRKHLTRVKWHELRRATCLRELEAATICPVNGFRDPEEYYAYATPRVEGIAVPLLVVHALDDPVIGVAELPFQRLRANPRVSVVLTRRGGHLGYYDTDENSRTLDAVVGAFFERHRNALQTAPRAKL